MRWTIRGSGWTSLAVGYDSGRGSLKDVVAWHDWLRRRWRGPLCVLGDSAGGHLALMPASRRPGIDCVVSRAAPVDLRREANFPQIFDEVVCPVFCWRRYLRKERAVLRAAR